jgi:hypothetical protein
MASKRTETIVIGLVLTLGACMGITKLVESPSPREPTPSEIAQAELRNMGDMSALNSTDGAIHSKSAAGGGPTSGDDRYRPPSAYPGMTRQEQISALMKADPGSYGYTDADRQFLREHGVSEAEARAAEGAVEH